MPDLDMNVWVARGQSFFSVRRGRIRTTEGVLRIESGGHEVLADPGRTVRLGRSREFLLVSGSGVQPAKLMFGRHLLVTTWVPAVLGTLLLLTGASTDDVALRAVLLVVGGGLVVSFRPWLIRSQTHHEDAARLVAWCEQAGPVRTGSARASQGWSVDADAVQRPLGSRMESAMVGFFAAMPVAVVLRVVAGAILAGVGLGGDLAGPLSSVPVVISLVVYAVCFVAPIAVLYRYYRRASGRMEAEKRKAEVGQPNDLRGAIVHYLLPFVVGIPPLLLSMLILL